jgi:hypothetical protein
MKNCLVCVFKVWTLTAVGWMFNYPPWLEIYYQELVIFSAVTNWIKRDTKKSTHQNVKLMMEGAWLKDIRLNDGTALSDYKCCLSNIMCDEAGTTCHLNECALCPGIENLKQELCMKLEEEMIDHITYKQWVSVDRCTFEHLKHSQNPQKSLWNPF